MSRCHLLPLFSLILVVLVGCGDDGRVGPGRDMGPGGPDGSMDMGVAGPAGRSAAQQVRAALG